MNTNTILIGLIVAAVVLGGGYWLLAGSQKTDDAMMENGDAMMEKEGDAMEVMEKDEGTMMQDEAAMETGDAMMEGEGAMMGKGTYEPYAPEKLAKADSGDVVLFFRASWCPTCKALDADIRANLSSLPGDLTILDVDYDNSSSLKQKYGVTYQHTLVQVDSDGTLIKKWSGSPTLVSLVTQVQ